MKQKKLNPLIQAGMIAALYAAFTYAAMMLNIAYGPVQFRFSEALTILPAVTSAAIPGLSIGCFLANLTSPYGPVDWIFGTLATLIAALLSRSLRKLQWKGIPYLAPLPPVLVNAVVVGLVVTMEVSAFTDGAILTTNSFSLTVFLSNFLWVGLGQLACCYGLGLPFYIALKKSGLLRFFESNQTLAGDKHDK